ncbi:mRNA transport regulator 3 [Tilletiaria anomala UBC 951]|uniref:mRNA transport regulator 3 n=1 Tax=Tilletiaria anomala (strain ATCC 24038 / CBS 436.72 / UBC 951) TaxID=1037660 RepID=A0A066WLP9_TILAU|nr:mRNA transport regulator 3 [Tilletiaria anomala UBC 951]KDN53523.1 mRNA transport regulator 3 [Tilletiaria anomala UBC 951]
MSASQLWDKRRNNGPEESCPPVYAHEELHVDLEVKRLCAATKGKAVDRGDGRTAQALRPIFLQCGLIPQASGSAYIETGGMKIACAIYGPRQIRGRQYSGKAELNVDVRYSPFATEWRKRPGKDAESASLGHHIHEALLPSLRLDLLPKASIDVLVQILEADGPEESCIAAAVTVASTALAEAGIETYGLVAGVCGAFVTCSSYTKASTSSAAVAVLPSPSFSLLVDPTRLEVQTSSALGWLQLNAMPALGSVTSMRHAVRGGMDSDELDAAVQQLMEKAVEVHYVMAKTLSENFASAQQS